MHESLWDGERKKEEGKKEREGREEHKAEMHEEVKESHAYKIRWKPLFSWLLMYFLLREAGETDCSSSTRSQ